MTAARPSCVTSSWTELKWVTIAATYLTAKKSFLLASFLSSLPWWPLWLLLSCCLSVNAAPPNTLLPHPSLRLPLPRYPCMKCQIRRHRNPSTIVAQLRPRSYQARVVQSRLPSMRHHLWPRDKLAPSCLYYINVKCRRHCEFVFLPSLHRVLSKGHTHFFFNLFYFVLSKYDLSFYSFAVNLSGTLIFLKFMFYQLSCLFYHILIFLIFAIN